MIVSLIYRFLNTFMALGLSLTTVSAGVTAEETITQSQGEDSVILVVGDSLSAAYNLAEEQGWVALMSQRLLQQNYQYRVVNASVGGATTAAALQRLPALLADYKPELLVLQMGANDGLQGKPVTYIRANLEKLILQTKASGAEVLLLGVRLPPNFGDRYTEPFYQQYHQLAEKHRLAYVPFLLKGVADQRSLMQKDRLHPTAEAQPIVLDVVWPVLKPLLQLPQAFNRAKPVGNLPVELALPMLRSEPDPQT